MRSRLILFLILVIALAVPLATAQEPAPPDEQVAWSQMVSGPYVHIPLEPMEGAPFSPNADPASDSCMDATELDLSSMAGDGAQTEVNAFTEAASDPLLSCMWGTPPNPSGFRTAWYKFIAPSGGKVVIQTVPNADHRDNYDTVLAVHAGNCVTHVLQACNDDSHGFLSRVELLVQAGETYYVEVADWHFGVNGAAKLNLIAVLEDADSFWSEQTTLAEGRSRHSVEVYDDEIYIISGQFVPGGTPTRTGEMMKWNPATGAVTNLAIQPGPDGAGYSNMDSALVNDRIYLPYGYVGDNDTYDGTHWVYDIPTNVWSTTIAAPFPSGPVGYAEAIAAPNVNGYYLIGGLLGEPLSPTAVPQNTMLRFRQGVGSIPDTWSSTPPPMTVARYMHTGAQLQTPLDWVCVIGGLTFGNALTEEGECYTTSGAWRLIAALNTPRFGAKSVIGPDGRWYVFGGRDGSFDIVETIEVYNPPANPANVGDLGSWSVLDARYNISAPPRTWVPGATVGENIYLVGGETGPYGSELVVSVIESLYFPPQLLALWQYFPAIFNVSETVVEHNDTLTSARELWWNEWMHDNFVVSSDFFDMFYIHSTETREAVVRLFNIPEGANYDVYVYNNNKLILGSGTNVGTNNEQFLVTLPPGNSYFMVVRAFPLGDPPDDNYSIRVGD